MIERCVADASHRSVQSVSGRFRSRVSRWWIAAALAVATVACGGEGAGGIRDAGCQGLIAAWEQAQAATQAVRDAAEDPAGPGGSPVTDAELKAIQTATDAQARARDAAAAAGCL